MFLLLAKRKPSSIILPLFSTHHNPCCSVSACTTQNPLPQTLNFNVNDYLVASFGFSPEKATRICKSIPHLKSPKNPEAVVRFLKQQGFSEAETKKFISWRPEILCSSPENILDPNLRALRELGLSTSALTQLILSNPVALVLRPAVPRIKFWRDFFGGDEVALVKAFKNNSGIVGHDINRMIVPKISLLQSHGLSMDDIRRILLTVRQLINKSTLLIDNLVNLAKELGFQPESRMFLYALQAMTWTPREAFQKKKELLKSFGWSENEFHSALQKCPTIVTLSAENLQTKIDFFVGEVGCDPSYIASFPTLLKYSLEKRLRPRQQVLDLLKLNGLCGKKHGLFTAMNLTESKFVEKFVLPHRVEISGLHESYLAACA